MRKFAGYLGIIIVGLAFLAALFIFIFPLVSRWEITTVRTGSMEPGIPVGSVVALAPIEAENVEIGDVILHVPPTNTSIRVTHRVIEIINSDQGLSFRTKGDANEDADPYSVPASNVISEVKLCIPYLGYFTNFARSKAGFITLLLIPGILVLFLTLKDIFGYSRYKERRKNLQRRIKQRKILIN
jgi:signal peptidase